MKNNRHLSEPTEFTPMLFKDQLYLIYYLCRLVPFREQRRKLDNLVLLFSLAGLQSSKSFLCIIATIYYSDDSENTWQRGLHIPSSLCLFQHFIKDFPSIILLSRII